MGRYNLRNGSLSCNRAMAAAEATRELSREEALGAPCAWRGPGRHLAAPG